MNIIKWLIFSCDLLSLYPAEHFLSMWLSDIIAIMNSNGNCASSWKIPLWISASAKLLPPAVNSALQVSMVFSIKFMTSCDIDNILLFILRFFHINVCWWSFIEVWMTASLLKFPGLFSVFWPISTMFYFGWSPFVLLFPTPPMSVPILWWLYQEHQFQLASPSLSCSIFFFNFLARPRYLSLFSLFSISTRWSAGTAKFPIGQVFCFCCCWLSLCLVVWPRSGDPFVSQNPKEVCATHFLGRILGCAYTICLYGEI